VTIMGTQILKAGLALGATETTYTDLGDITVPKGVSRITGICAIAVIEEGTAAEGAIGVAKLEWTGAPELDGIPCATTCVIDVGQIPLVPEFTPVNIPVEPYKILSFSLYGNSPFSKVIMQHAYSGFAASGVTDPDGFFSMTPNITFEARTADNLTIVHVANVAGKVYGCIAIEEEY